MNFKVRVELIKVIGIQPRTTSRQFQERAFLTPTVPRVHIPLVDQAARYYLCYMGSLNFRSGNYYLDEIK